uniref:hypothetical protein n=1 Tax=Tissierella praeacuta TaxID=43131 RepID=UPI003341A5B8
ICLEDLIKSASKHIIRGGYKVKEQQGKINKGSRIFAVILILSMSMLLPFMLNTLQVRAEDSEIIYMDYKDLLEMYKKEYNCICQPKSGSFHS